MKTILSNHRRQAEAAAFSMVEVLAALAIIGIIIFLALPNIVQVKSDGEQSLAIARAESLNMAMASYVQAVGSTQAETNWDASADDSARYANYLSPYLAFAPSTLANYLPAGYSVSLPGDVTNAAMVTLTGPSGTISY